MAATDARRLLIAYVATLVSFLALDAIWLGTMAQRLYAPAIGHLMRPGFAWEPALAFYLLYVLGLVVSLLFTNTSTPTEPVGGLLVAIAGLWMAASAQRSLS